VDNKNLILEEMNHEILIRRGWDRSPCKNNNSFYTLQKSEPAKDCEFLIVGPRRCNYRKNKKIFCNEEEGKLPGQLQKLPERCPLTPPR